MNQPSEKALATLARIKAPCDTHGISQPDTSDVTGVDYRHVTQADVTPCTIISLSQMARSLAKSRNLSVRTAYRHLARGTDPHTERRIGGDGKTYPAHPRPLVPQAMADLRLAWQALNRAERHGDTEGITVDDADLLHRIAQAAVALDERWKGAFDKPNP